MIIIIRIYLKSAAWAIEEVIQNIFGYWFNYSPSNSMKANNIV